jgi:hypothetical protein
MRPPDRKWHRNPLFSEIVVLTPTRLDMGRPEAEEDLGGSVLT